MRYRVECALRRRVARAKRNKVQYGGTENTEMSRFSVPRVFVLNISCACGAFFKLKRERTLPRYLTASLPLW